MAQMKDITNRHSMKEGSISSPKAPRIGVLMGEKANPFWSELRYHLGMLGRDMGFEIRFFWPSSQKGIVENQARVFQRILDLDFDLIIINPLSRDNLVSGIMQAAIRKIPVLDVGAKTDPEAVSRTKPYYFPIRTVDFFRQGMMGAKHIIRKIKSRETQRVVILEGRKEATQSMGRSQGAADAFSKNRKIQLVSREPADFERLKAKKIATRIMTECPEVDAFFCANDLMALGVADAIGNLKRMRKVSIVGVDLIQESREAIRSGIMDASVAFSTASVANAVLKSALMILRGKAVTDKYQVKSSLVSIENLDTWDDQTSV
jgi:ABC-type sugar transport system substrate-binding protein